MSMRRILKIRPDYLDYLILVLVVIVNCQELVNKVLALDWQTIITVSAVVFSPLRHLLNGNGREENEI